MSITVNQSPQQYTPVNNEIIHVVDSTNKAQPNFKYVLDLYIEGNAPDFYRKTRSPDPTTGLAWFDLHSEIKSFISQDLNITTYGFQTNPNSGKKYSVYFGEQYGPSSGITVYSGLTVAPSRYVWNGTFNFLSFKDYAVFDFVLAGAQLMRFLTDMPDPCTVRSDENRWLYGINIAAGNVDKMRIKTYSSPNAVGLIQTVDVLNTYSGVTSTEERFIRFGYGGANINQIPGASITAGVQPIITPTVKSYTVQAITSTGTVMSEMRTFNIEDDCSKYTMFTFHFFNELGGFDTYSFINANKKEVSIKRDKMKKIVGSLSGGRFEYNKYDRQKTVYNTQLQDRITVNSGMVTSDVSTWLEQLITSPVVFLDDPTHGLVAVDIIQDSYEIKQNVTSKTFNVSFSFEYCFNRTR